MIINANGVNIDTNTMRSNVEIAQIVNLLTENSMRRTQLFSFSVNQNYPTSGATTIESFDFNDNDMFSYTALMFEFIGTWEMTAGTSETYCSLAMRTDSGDSVTLGYMSADRNATTRVNDIRTVLTGIGQYRTTSKYTRRFMCGNIGVEFDGTFSGYIYVSPSNSPTNVKINGTIKIYGIK